MIVIPKAFILDTLVYQVVSFKFYFMQLLNYLLLHRNSFLLLLVHAFVFKNSGLICDIEIQQTSIAMIGFSRRYNILF